MSLPLLSLQRRALAIRNASNIAPVSVAAYCLPRLTTGLRKACLPLQHVVNMYCSTTYQDADVCSRADTRIRILFFVFRVNRRT